MQNISLKNVDYCKKDIKKIWEQTNRVIGRKTYLSIDSTIKQVLLENNNKK